MGIRHMQAPLSEHFHPGMLLCLLFAEDCRGLQTHRRASNLTYYADIVHNNKQWQCLKCDIRLARKDASHQRECKGPRPGKTLAFLSIGKVFICVLCTKVFTARESIA